MLTAAPAKKNTNAQFFHPDYFNRPKDRDVGKANHAANECELYEFTRINLRSIRSYSISISGIGILYGCVEDSLRGSSQLNSDSLNSRQFVFIRENSRRKFKEFSFRTLTMPVPRPGRRCGCVRQLPD